MLKMTVNRTPNNMKQLVLCFACLHWMLLISDLENGLLELNCSQSQNFILKLVSDSLSLLCCLIFWGLLLGNVIVPCHVSGSFCIICIIELNKV